MLLTPTAAETLRRLRAADGQTLTEYGMILGIIAIVVVALALLVGSEVSALFPPVLNYL